MPDLHIDQLARGLGSHFARLGDAIALSAAVFAGILIAARLLAALMRRTATRQPRHATLLTILARAIWVGGIILGALSALQNLGVDVTAFVASLGLLGITIGFALRDITSSFVAGLLIIVYRPFRPGDRISVQGVEGRVVAIDLRYTTLQSDGRVHLVPNSTILTNPVTVMAEPPPGAEQSS